MALKLFYALNFLIIAIALYQMKKSYGRFDQPMALPLFCFTILLLVPIALNIIEHLRDYNPIPLLHSDIGFLNSAFIIPVWIWVLSEYTSKKKNELITYLMIEPLIITVAFTTNDFHHLMYDGTTVYTYDNDITRETRDFGILRMVHATYISLLWNVGCSYFAYQLTKRHPNRRIVYIVLWACLIGIQGLFLLNLTGLSMVRLGGPIFLVLLLWSIYFANIFEMTTEESSLPHQLLDDTLVTADQNPFRSQVLEIINKHLNDDQFDTNRLSQLIGLSRSQLNRKLQKHFNVSTAALIRQIRLNKAHELLKNGDHSIAEVAYNTGFSSQAYFSTCFKSHFGISPKNFILSKL